MKTSHHTRGFLSVAAAFALLIPVAAIGASTVTFDNQSGKPALVKLIGPTASSVTVENAKKEPVSVAPGHYFIKVRYGTPGAYAYSKGDEFDVTETATTTSDITITLHKVVAGNYGSKTISEAEFGTDENTNKQESATMKTQEPKTDAIKQLLPLFGRVASSHGPISPLTEEALQTSFEVSDKIINLMREKLGADKPSSGSFIRLPEVIAEIDKWSIRPDYIDLLPDNHVSLEQLRKVLGPDCKTNTTHNTTVPGLANYTDVDWCCYGRWNFGGTNNAIEVIRVHFAKSSETTKDKTQK